MMSSITIPFGIFTLLTTLFYTTLRDKLGFNRTKAKLFWEMKIKVIFYCSQRLPKRTLC
jgi:hypothetical protein